MAKKKKAKSDGLPWYHQGLQFECTQCGACCSGEPGYVWVDDEEITQLASRLNLTREVFESTYVEEVGAFKSLKERDNGDCSLLDEESRRCTVYEDRPVQCRTWPFWDSTVKTRKDWRATCEMCPGAGHGRLYTFQEIESRRREREV